MAEIKLSDTFWIHLWPCSAEGGRLVPAEPIQEKGRLFVYDTKRYLEGTCKIIVDGTVYDPYGVTGLQMLNHKKTRYDLRAHYRDAHSSPIYVEAKDYGPIGGLNTHYVDFVLRSYSAFAYLKGDDSSVKCPYFMFAASRPFRSSDYGELLTHGWVRTVVERAAEERKYGIETVDDDIVTELVDRLWLVVWSNHQNLFCVRNPRAVIGAVEQHYKEGDEVL